MHSLNPLTCTYRYGKRISRVLHHRCRRVEGSGSSSRFIPFYFPSNRLNSGQCGFPFSRTVSSNHTSFVPVNLNVFSAQCILFLAPLAFNETLEEDPKVNRLVRFTLSPIHDTHHQVSHERRTASIYGVKFVVTNYSAQCRSSSSSTRRTFLRQHLRQGFKSKNMCHLLRIELMMSQR